MHIVIAGNPMDGIGFYGPFEKADTAMEWAEIYFRNGDITWWVDEVIQTTPTATVADTSWITNPGTDERESSPYIRPKTVVRVRFRGNPHAHTDSYDDEGEVGEFYWLHDGEDSDIVEYQIIKE